MSDSKRYVKIVEWSDEDKCFIGRAPGLTFGGCHGDDEKAVFAELCDIVDEVVESHKRHGDPLPPATVGCDWDTVIDCAPRPEATDNNKAA